MPGIGAQTKGGVGSCNTSPLCALIADEAVSTIELPHQSGIEIKWGIVKLREVYILSSKWRERKSQYKQSQNSWEFDAFVILLKNPEIHRSVQMNEKNDFLL